MMKGLHELIGFRCHDCAGGYYLTLRVCPIFVKPGHCKGLFVPQENIEGLFSHSGPLPFVKPIRDDKTPLFFESIPEAWLLYERFGPGVDKFIRNGFVFRPVRNKAPLHGDELPFALFHNDGNRLPRGDVIGRRQVALDLRCIEDLPNFPHIRFSDESTAHLNFSRLGNV